MFLKQRINREKDIPEMNQNISKKTINTTLQQVLSPISYKGVKVLLENWPF